MLDYICGTTSHNEINGGLKLLTEIALPYKSFVTASGFKVSKGLYFSGQIRIPQLSLSNIMSDELLVTEKEIAHKAFDMVRT